MKALIRLIIILCGLLALWQFIVIIGHLPPYILPTPIDVIHTCITQMPLLLAQSVPTIIETLLGLAGGVILGFLIAILMAYIQSLRAWLTPILLISQALPTFAIAPLLVIWFGYGMSAKIVTTILMLFFPVTSAFFDGLRRTDSGFLDLAQTMGATRWRILRYIRLPAAMPALVTGMRVATACAPIGAVIGEWVGASRGLGFLMLNANARMQIDVMFAALFMLVLWSLLLYFSVNYCLKFLIRWQKEV